MNSFRKYTKKELAAIHAKTSGVKGVPAPKFLQHLNQGVKYDALKVTNVRMFVDSKKPHTEVHFKKGIVKKVREHSDPEKAVYHARMLVQNDL